MNRNRFMKTIVFVLLIAGVLQAGIMAYSAVANQVTGRYEEAASTGAHAAALPDTAIQEVEIPGKEIDISMITLKKEVEDMITSLDGENAARNIRNYKILLASMNVPESFQIQIEDMYGSGYRVQDVLVAYEYLYREYGNISELEGLVEQKVSGKAWKDIFREYKKDKKEFVPRDFEAGELEEIFTMPGITPDDVIIADRIAIQAGAEFDELIAMRGRGMNWKSINEGLGIVNTSDTLPRAAITSIQVKNYMKSTGLGENEVLEALVLAQKLDEDGEAVIYKIKAGKTEEEIIAESLEKKYQ